MKTVSILRVNTGYAKNVFENDIRGNIIQPSGSKTINVCICNEVQIPQGKISFYTVVKIDKADINESCDAEKLAISWLKNDLPNRLTKASYWNFFSQTWLTTDSVQPIVPTAAYLPTSTEVELNQPLIKLTEEAIAHLSHVKMKFDGAKERLRYLAENNMPLGFAQTVGEARVLLYTIENVLDASADVGGDNPSKARSVMRDYEELARRKVESNHNYKSALDSLKRFVFGVEFPTTWMRKPNI